MAILQTPLLDRLLELANDRRASDLFLIPGEPPTFRIGSDVSRDDELPVLDEGKIRQVAEDAIGRDVIREQIASIGRASTSVSLPGAVSGRMYVASSFGRLTIAIRILPGMIPDARLIELPEAVLDLADAERGLILFSGPTGSGKTTSALAFLDYINTTQRRMINTVEDPIASGSMSPKRSLVVQREVGSDVPDIVSGITTSIWQDADVILVGELRCAQDVEAAVSAAGTRSLVVSQLHQPTPATAIWRLIQSQPLDRRVAVADQLASVLRCVVAQVLLPKVNGGRVAAYGVMLADDVVRHAIRHLQSPPDIAGKPGSRTLQDDIQRLKRDGVVAAASADAASEALKMHASDNPRGFDALSVEQRRALDEAQE